jgi:hypothetical protein
MKSQGSLWGFRVLIGHEMGHVMAGHTFTTSAMQGAKELEADKLGIGYFKKLDWPCSRWVEIRKQQIKSVTDSEHDRQAMYEQAVKLCPEGA